MDLQKRARDSLSLVNRMVTFISDARPYLAANAGAKAALARLKTASFTDKPIDVRADAARGGRSRKARKYSAL